MILMVLMVLILLEIIISIISILVMMRAVLHNYMYPFSGETSHNTKVYKKILLVLHCFGLVLYHETL